MVTSIAHPTVTHTRVVNGVERVSNNDIHAYTISRPYHVKPHVVIVGRTGPTTSKHKRGTGKIERPKAPLPVTAVTNTSTVAASDPELGTCGPTVTKEPGDCRRSLLENARSHGGRRNRANGTVGTSNTPRTIGRRGTHILKKYDDTSRLDTIRRPTTVHDSRNPEHIHNNSIIYVPHRGAVPSSVLIPVNTPRNKGGRT